VEELDAQATTLTALLHARRVRPRAWHLVVPPLAASGRALLARGPAGGSWGAGRSPCWMAIAPWSPTPSSGSCAGRRPGAGGEGARVVRSPALGRGARRDPRGPGARARGLAAGAAARAAARRRADCLRARPRLPP